MPASDGMTNLENLISQAGGRRARRQMNGSGAATPDPAMFTVGYWLKRDLPPPEPLLGQVITKGSKTWIFGPTGAGKTHHIYGMSGGLATGGVYAHWKATRPCKVLCFDGEMSRDLVQQRLEDLARRETNPADKQRLLDNLIVISMDDYPDEAPFNTDEGRAWALSVVEAVKPDVVVADNRMALTAGVMKDEEAWIDTLPLVVGISRTGAAQIWIDHTGHDVSHGYGTKTKEWRFDNVMMLSAVDRPDADLAFKIEFTKCRRRTPDNRADFEPMVLALIDDVWSATAAAPSVSPGKRGADSKKLRPDDKIGLARLNNAVASLGRTVPQGDGFPSKLTKGVNVETWRSAFYDAIPDRPTATRRTYFKRVLASLIANNLVATHLEWVWPVHDGDDGDPGPARWSGEEKRQ